MKQRFQSLARQAASFSRTSHMSMTTRDHRFTSSTMAKQISLPRTYVHLSLHPGVQLHLFFFRGDDLYQPGTTLNLKFQPHESADYKDVAAMVIKCFEPFTSAIVLLVQRHSDNEKLILKLADRRLGYHSGKGRPVPWSLSPRRSSATCHT